VDASSEPVGLVRLLSDEAAAGHGEAAPSNRAGAAELVAGMRLWEPRSTPPRVPEGGERPRVLLNMACTADGRATIGGRSGPIGNRADRELFHALRTAVDAVLVGGATARAEGYGRLVREDSARRLRRARGLAEEPLACVVSASLALPAREIPLLADPGARVTILTPSSASLPQSVAAVEYVRCARAGRLDLPGALVELRRRLAVRTVLCEGGPHLSGQLLAAGLVDELFLTLAPKLAGGDAAGGSLRILAGPELEPPAELELLEALESESQLLLRYRVLRAGEPRVDRAGGAGGADAADAADAASAGSSDPPSAPPAESAGSL
jgi:riboflavin-specific deaminase-like protein